VHLQVEIRACTSTQDPIIVDINNAMQQVYVFGTMVWAGSIKFINTFPSPRRGGMFALVSVLSVEGNGSVEFRVRSRPDGPAAASTGSSGWDMGRKAAAAAAALAPVLTNSAACCATVCAGVSSVANFLAAVCLGTQ
jgi:hypothetical protein